MEPHDQSAVKREIKGALIKQAVLQWSRTIKVR